MNNSQQEFEKMLMAGPWGMGRHWRRAEQGNRKEQKKQDQAEVCHRFCLLCNSLECLYLACLH